MTVNARWRIGFEFRQGDANGRRAVSADTAVRLGRYFGNGAQFWLDLQSQHDIALPSERGEEIARRVAAAKVA